MLESIETSVEEPFQLHIPPDGVKPVPPDEPFTLNQMFNRVPLVEFDTNILRGPYENLQELEKRIESLRMDGERPFDPNDYENRKISKIAGDMLDFLSRIKEGADVYVATDQHNLDTGHFFMCIGIDVFRAYLDALDETDLVHIKTDLDPSNYHREGVTESTGVVFLSSDEKQCRKVEADFFCDPHTAKLRARSRGLNGLIYHSLGSGSLAAKYDQYGVVADTGILKGRVGFEVDQMRFLVVETMPDGCPNTITAVPVGYFTSNKG